MSPRFFLGTHQPGWLAHLGVPLFVSDRRLRGYRKLPRAAGPWALDSGGFTELSQHGSWRQGPTPAEYAARVRRYQQDIGALAWAAPQDWMCEPSIIARSGLSVAEHQQRTIDNFLHLRTLAADLPFIPVLQGWTPADYLRCADRYTRAGIDLTRADLVGVGSVCRRQATTEAGRILTTLHAAGLHRLHGFGFKTLGLASHGHLLTSADSMAWSMDARRKPPLPGCLGQHRNCANCPRYALTWRTRLLATLDRHPVQPALFEVAGCASDPARRLPTVTTDQGQSKPHPTINSPTRTPQPPTITRPPAHPNHQPTALHPQPQNPRRSQAHRCISIPR